LIIVTGTVKVRADALDRALAVSLEHVRRSRTEPGCLVHSVHQDVEDPLSIVFFEQWADRDALDAHFKVSASNDFVAALRALSTERPTMSIYEATPLS
jgi:quinol monooxygenase YgiN